MKRPEKKKELGTMSPEDVMEVRGWNRACDYYDMFLPNVKEIREILGPSLNLDRPWLAEKIAKRLGGAKW